MAFLFSLHTGKPCSPDDLLAPNGGEVSAEDQDKKDAALAAYYSGMRRKKKE